MTIFILALVINTYSWKQPNVYYGEKGKKIAQWNTYKITFEVCPEGIQPCHMKNRDIY